MAGRRLSQLAGSGQELPLMIEFSK